VADQQRSASTPAAAGDDSGDYVAYPRIIVGTGEPCDRVNRTFVAGTDKRTNGIYRLRPCRFHLTFLTSGYA
jgi:hypothetical protein